MQEQTKLELEKKLKRQQTKEDVELLKIPAEEQIRRELYQQTVSDNLRIEIREELERKPNFEKFVCKSKIEFMKRKEKK